MFNPFSVSVHFMHFDSNFYFFKFLICLVWDRLMNGNGGSYVTEFCSFEATCRDVVIKSSIILKMEADKLSVKFSKC